MVETCVPSSAGGNMRVSLQETSAVQMTGAGQPQARGTAKRNRRTFEQQGEAIDMVPNKHMKVVDVGKQGIRDHITLNTAT